MAFSFFKKIGEDILYPLSRDGDNYKGSRGNRLYVTPYSDKGIFFSLSFSVLAKDFYGSKVDWIHLDYFLRANNYGVFFNKLIIVNLLPEILLISLGILLFAGGALYFRRFRDEEDVPTRALIIFNNLSLSVVFLCGFLLFYLLREHRISLLVFYDFFTIDWYSLSMKFLCTIVTGIILIFLKKYIENTQIHNFEVSSLFLLLLFGCYISLDASNLMTLYLGLEIMSLTTYILICSGPSSSRVSEAATKYFIIGGFSSILLLWANVMFYLLFSSMGYWSLRNYCSFNDAFSVSKVPLTLIFSLLLLAVALLIKFGASPFHFWIFDVYEGSPLIVTLALASLNKVVLFSLLLRLFGAVFFGLHFLWFPLFSSCAFFSVIVGTFGGIFQYTLKRLLAYSSVSHVGFMLWGFSSISFFSIYSALFYLYTYVLATLLVFGILITFFDQKEGKYINYLTDLTYFSKKQRSKESFFLALGLFSMAGVPPFIGFFAKFFIFFAPFDEGFFWTSLFLVLCSLVSTFYYLKLIKISFFDSFRRLRMILLSDLEKDYIFLFFFLSLLTLIFFLVPGPFLFILEMMTRSLLFPFSYGLVY